MSPWQLAQFVSASEQRSFLSQSAPLELANGFALSRDASARSLQGPLKPELRKEGGGDRKTQYGARCARPPKMRRSARIFPKVPLLLLRSRRKEVEEGGRALAGLLRDDMSHPGNELSWVLSAGQRGGPIAVTRGRSACFGRGASSQPAAAASSAPCKRWSV